MNKQLLLKHLAQLHADLREAEQADPETVQLMQTVTQDIERLLDRTAAPSDEEREPVTSGLNSLLLRFEANHPKLSARLGEVADALAGMGF